MEAYLGAVLMRAFHVLFGILWIGLLYYFNFVQTEYFKDSTPEAKSDVVKKLVPNALWYFRYAALFTFLTGLYLLYWLGIATSVGIALGAIMATFMAANVWFIIWPNQKKALGIVDTSAEEKPIAAKKAMLTSRVNTLLSIPMLLTMVAAQNLY